MACDVLEGKRIPTKFEVNVSGTLTRRRLCLLASYWTLLIFCPCLTNNLAVNRQTHAYCHNRVGTRRRHFVITFFSSMAE